MGERAVILCATDLSPAADEAIRQADERARLWGADLAIVHAIPLTYPGVPMFPQRVQQTIIERERIASTTVDTILNRTKALTGRSPDDLSIYIEDGPPAVAVVNRAEALGARLVVVGSLGTTGLARLLLGSVAERVVLHAPGSVLVARPTPPSKRILAATDFSERANKAVRTAAQEAKGKQAHLLVLHALELIHPGAGLGEPLASPAPPNDLFRLEDLRPAALKRLRQMLADLGVDGEAQVSEDPPAAAILRAVEANDAELVVVGTAGRTGLRRMLLGSVAQTVVRHAPCSVLVVRSD